MVWLVCLGALVVSGCGAPGAKRVIAIAVRDGATGRPVEGALVRVNSAHFFLPAYPHQRLDGVTPLADAAVTDERGVAQVMMYEHYPMQLFVYAFGQMPLVLPVDELPDRRGEANVWLGAHDVRDDALRSTLEVQVRR